MLTNLDPRPRYIGLLVSAALCVSVFASAAACWAQSGSAVQPSINDDYFSGDYYDEPLDAIPTLAELQPREEERQPERAPAPRTRTRRPTDRLSSVPQMFGDFFATSGQVLLIDQATNQAFLADVPTAGGSRRVKIAENNKAYTDDRVYFMYNHFNNALQTHTVTPFPNPMNPVVTGLGQGRQYPVDRYTFGIEKSFLDGTFSAELRLPFTSTYQFAAPSVSGPPAAGIGGGKVGNVAVILKALLFASDTHSVAAGLGIDLPTGSDVNAFAGPSTFTVQNQSYHFLPYIGFMKAPNDRIFFNAFGQLDLAANGNAIDAQDPLGVMGRAGKYTEQNLLYLDAAGGVWLYQNPDAPRLTGLAGIAELHYTTTLQNSDTVLISRNQTQFSQTLLFQNFANRQDILNVTAGLHAQMGYYSNLRVAVVVPVRQNNAPIFGPTDRFFGSEVQVQFNRRY